MRASRMGDDLATVLEKVRGLVERLSPEPICDDCITEKLSLSVRQHANHKTRELAGEHGFERRIDACTICGTAKTVIRHKCDRFRTARSKAFGFATRV